MVPFRYEYPIDRLLHQVKQRNDFALLNALGWLFGENSPSPPRQAVIIPVPSDFVSISRRGFNQAAVFAERLASANHLPVDYCSVAKRWQNRVRQKSLRARQRHENARQSFYFRGNAHFSTVVIVDDVVTTGATSAKLASLLRANGATKVSCYALAAKL